jgi:hypothetical protein
MGDTIFGASPTRKNQRLPEIQSSRSAEALDSQAAIANILPSGKHDSWLPIPTAGPRNRTAHFETLDRNN